MEDHEQRQHYGELQPAGAGRDHRAVSVGAGRPGWAPLGRSGRTCPGQPVGGVALAGRAPPAAARRQAPAGATGGELPSTPAPVRSAATRSR
jgi:hypothetical protein